MNIQVRGEYPLKDSLEGRYPKATTHQLDMLRSLLKIRPADRPTASEALGTTMLFERARQRWVFSRAVLRSAIDITVYSCAGGWASTAELWT